MIWGMPGAEEPARYKIYQPKGKGGHVLNLWHDFSVQQPLTRVHVRVYVR